jgi:hypothetical protein
VKHVGLTSVSTILKVLEYNGVRRIIRVVMIFLANFCNATCPELWVKEMAEKEFQSESPHVQFGVGKIVFHPVTFAIRLKFHTEYIFSHYEI